jgi:hypothetical protein
MNTATSSDSKEMIFPGKVVQPLKLVNHNNKRYCSLMVEINRSPKERVPDSVLRNTVYAISWSDGGEIGYYELIDIMRFKLSELRTTATIASHGLWAGEFRIWFQKNNKGTNLDTEMAIYIYKKIER